MSRARYALIGAVAIALVLSIPFAQAGAKRIKSYNAQTSYTFTNTEQVSPQGLVVAMSAAAEVVTDDETGSAGPFRNVRGNGSSKITLTNASSPIDAAGGDNSSVDLVFRSYNSKLEVKSWWWIDERGKRIGKKQKG